MHLKFLISIGMILITLLEHEERGERIRKNKTENTEIILIILMQTKKILRIKRDYLLL
jgi:hypothetical protein